MYKIPFVVCLVILFSDLSFGQISIGLNGAISQNKLLTNTENEPQLTYKKSYGSSVAIEIQYKFYKQFSIVIQPSYIQKNYRVQNDSDTTNALAQRVTNTYIQLPLAGKLAEQFNHVNISVEAGGFLGYWLKSNEGGTVEGVYFSSGYSNTSADEGNIPFNSIRDNKLEYGWLLGSEIGYNIATNLSANLTYSFYQSLTDQQKNYMIQHIQRYNRTQVWGVGFTYSLSHLEHTKSN